MLNGAAKAVHAERHDEAFPKTVIVSKFVEDVKGTQQDALGKSKNLGQSQVPRGNDFVHGVKNDVTGWNGAKCIRGEPSEKELLPDIDLGKSVRLNCTNRVRSAKDGYRSFGIPSIRTDIPFKLKRSVADYTNYGDEPEAVDLLFPQTNTAIGVSELDFQKMRSRSQIEKLFANCGITYKVGKFNAIYNKAKEICEDLGLYATDKDDKDFVSVRAMM